MNECTQHCSTDDVNPASSLECVLKAAHCSIQSGAQCFCCVKAFGLCVCVRVCVRMLCVCCVRACVCVVCVCIPRGPACVSINAVLDPTGTAGVLTRVVCVVLLNNMRGVLLTTCVLCCLTTCVVCCSQLVWCVA